MEAKPKIVTKKFINKVGDCVDENIAGYVALHPGLRQLAGYPRVVVRADLLEHKAAGRVAVLVGGGSGHEPAFTGWIGNNMATGAVLGDVFAAPGSVSILAAIRALGRNNPGGVLLLFNNYTGDRLNFGIAAERARAEGLRVEMVLNADDTALVTADKTAGRRGLAGLLFLVKIAGSLAEEGKSLDEILSSTSLASSRMGTLGLCINSCSVPGSGPLFQVGEQDMELGLGLHGEAGVKTVKMKSAADTVKIMLQHMANTDNKIHLPITKGDHVAVLVNNLGSLSDMEMNILSKEVIEQLEVKGVNVDRAYCGRSVTSQEMAGFSVTIIHVDEERKRIFDKETKAPAWLKPNQICPGNRLTPCSLNVDVIKTDSESRQEYETVLSNEESTTLRKVIKSVCQSLVDSEDFLNRLDSRSGDGDCGSTLKTAAQKCQAVLTEDSLFLNPSHLLLTVADIIEESSGGTSGALYSIFLTTAGSKLAKLGNERNWVDALHAGLLAVQKYGGAELGDRTMVDPLHAALKTVSAGGSNREVLERAVEAAEKEAELTAQMTARAGRASYVNSEYLTQPDPGAKAVAIWMRAVYSAIYA